MDWVSDKDEKDSDTFSWDSDENDTESLADPLEVSEAGPSRPSLYSHFIGMGFNRDMVEKAITENGEGNVESILETLLTYTAIGNNHSEQEGALDCQNVPDDHDAPVESSLSCHEDSGDNDLCDSDDSNDEDFKVDLPEKDKKLLTLIDMGFSPEESSAAIDRCGHDSSVLELADSIHAAQMADEAGGIDWDYRKPRFESSEGFNYCSTRKKRRLTDENRKVKRCSLSQTRRDYPKKPTHDFEDERRTIPKPMIGFGLPYEKCITQRTLPEAAIGPPYFYYENVALAPSGVWDTISRFLFDIEPEFVDSKHFCAASRKRAYIHNLPIENRFPLLPIPAKTIQEALPVTKRWWPKWDPRTQLNCLQTCIASAKLTDRIRKALESSSDPPSQRVQEYVLAECRKWNLVWVGHHKLAPLEPDEVELLLGFPNNHTRGGGISRTDRYKSLGNSFQVNTVAYHLSVLKKMFPNGINLLSLFSGIGGAEVALQKLGVPLKSVVSVEKSEINRNIVRSWWEQTNQKGDLIDLDDVQQLNGDMLESLIKRYGGFDLVIGGSPCNNLAGSNRHTREGLEGQHSALFYDYFRILDLVKCIMGKNL